MQCASVQNYPPPIKCQKVVKMPVSIFQQKRVIWFVRFSWLKGEHSRTGFPFSFVPEPGLNIGPFLFVVVVVVVVVVVPHSFFLVLAPLPVSWPCIPIGLHQPATDIISPDYCWFSKCHLSVCVPASMFTVSKHFLLNFASAYLISIWLFCLLWILIYACFTCLRFLACLSVVNLFSEHSVFGLFWLLLASLPHPFF